MQISRGLSGLICQPNDIGTGLGLSPTSMTSTLRAVAASQWGVICRIVLATDFAGASGANERERASELVTVTHT